MGQILIGIAGPARVGKDTSAKYLADEFSLLHYAFANPIKDALSGMGFPRATYDENPERKDEVIPDLGVSYRKLAQTLGTEWGRSIAPDFWLRLAVRRFGVLATLPTAYRGMVISDVRFENEAQWVRQNGLLIHINGTPRAQIAGDGATHVSEAGVSKVPGDLIVNNTADLTFLFGQLHHGVTRTFFN